MLLFWSFQTCTASERKTNYIYNGHASYDWFAARLRYMLEKLFSRGPSGKHRVGPKFSFRDEMFGRNLLFLARSRNHVLVIVKTNIFEIDGGRLV